MRFVPLALATLCLLVFFIGLDRIAATDWREARDAEVAREIVARREVLAPIYAYEPLFEKPILGYAPEVVARLLDPRSPLRSRQIRGGLAVALILLTASIGARHFGMRAAWLSALVLGSSLALPFATRADGTQLLATLLGWVTCAGLADVAFGRSAGRDLRLVVTYGALGAVLVCAGPLPALWPLGGLLLYTALARTPGVWERARPVAGLLLAAGVALPWYGAMIERYGADFLAHAPFFPYAVETRVSWFSGALFAPSFLVTGFFPWCALLPGAMLHAATGWRERRLPEIFGRTVGIAGADPVSREVREESAAHFFIAALFAALAPIAIYPGAPLTAVLPALPAAALLVGRFLDHLFEAPERLASPLTRAMLMLALLGTVAALLLAMTGGRLRDPAPQLRQIATLLFVTSWAPFLADFLGRRRLAAGLLALPVALGTPIASVRLLPAMEGWLNTRQVAEAAATVMPPHSPLITAGSPPPSLRLFAARNLVPSDSVAADARRFPAADGHAYVAFRPARERAVAQELAIPLEILLRTPTLVLARVRER